METPCVSLKWRQSFPKHFPPICLVCGVDSGPIRIFLICVMGGLVLSAVCVLLWALGTKRVGLGETQASLAIEAENDDRKP